MCSLPRDGTWMGPSWQYWEQEREWANGRTGETANGRMKALDRWGEKLGAPKMWLTATTVPRRFEPLRGCTTPPRVWRGWRTILSWAMQPARMAQIRRDPASEVVSVSPRRDLRPTGSWVPFRPRAHSPHRPRRLTLPFYNPDRSGFVSRLARPRVERRERQFVGRNVMHGENLGARTMVGGASGRDR